MPCGLAVRSCWGSSSAHRLVVPSSSFPTQQQQQQPQPQQPSWQSFVVQRRFLTSTGSGSGDIPAKTSSSSDPVALQQVVAALLQRELEDEADIGGTNASDELTALLNNLVGPKGVGWKLEQAHAVTILKRTVGNLNVQVSFHCQDTVDLMQDDFENENDQDEEGNDKEEQEQDDDDYEASEPVRFTVTLTPTTGGGEKNALPSLVCTCLSDSGQARIQSIATTREDLFTVQIKGGVSAEAYQGPVFDELTEDVQEAFHDLLRDTAGIDGDVAALVAMYADHREQIEYVQFLKDAVAVLK